MSHYTIESSGAFVESFIVNPYNAGVLSEYTFAVKDCIDLKNKVTGFGNPTWKKTHPAAVENAVCVDLLLGAGARCLGKTVTDEFTYSLVGENFFDGTPINPRAPEAVPGGSSSGSASAVACGLVDFALGTDTGGSIRVPASHCGIYGYRPTHGRISTAGVLPLAPSLDTVGILASEFKTLQQVASVLLGKDMPSYPEQYEILLIEEFMAAAHPSIREAVVNYLNHHHLKYTSKKLFSITWLGELNVLIHSCELWSVYGDWITHTKPELGPITHYNFHSIAKTANRQKLGEAMQKRAQLIDSTKRALKKNTILCFPTVPEAPPKKGGYSLNPEARTKSDYFQRLIGINALAGLSKAPQITLPMNDVSAEPAGISFMAAQNEDESLFNFLSQFLGSKK